MKYLVVATLAAALMTAACQSPETAHDKTAAKKPDVRQGQEVSQVCFNQQIRNWRENDNRSVIIEKGFKQEYKLDLIGACEPSDAFTSIGLISRFGGGSCLSNGDRLVTDARFGQGPCTIQRIYEWHKDANKPPPAAAAPTAS